MSELIGTSFLIHDSFKHHLLLFDRIACPTASLVIADPGSDPRRVAVSQDLQYLQERGLLFTTEFVPKGFVISGSTPTTEQLFEMISRLAAGATTVDPFDAAAREYAVQLRSSAGLNAVPVTSRWPVVADEPLTRTEVLQVVFKCLPVPGSHDSLDDVLEFREQMRALGLTQGLRVWMNEVASGRLTEIEISDKLEDLFSRYERALGLERTTRETGIVETLVTTTAEIAESLVKFQWSKVAKKLFDVRHKQIDLMKAEMTAPGREVAYIVKARERFGSRS